MRASPLLLQGQEIEQLKLSCDALVREKEALENALQMAAEACRSTEQAAADRRRDSQVREQEMETITARLRRLCNAAEQCSVKSGRDSVPVGDTWEELAGLLEYW